MQCWQHSNAENLLKKPSIRRYRASLTKHVWVSDYLVHCLAANSKIWFIFWMKKYLRIESEWRNWCNLWISFGFIEICSFWCDISGVFGLPYFIHSFCRRFDVSAYCDFDINSVSFDRNCHSPSCHCVECVKFERDRCFMLSLNENTMQTKANGFWFKMQREHVHDFYQLYDV